MNGYVLAALAAGLLALWFFRWRGRSNPLQPRMDPRQLTTVVLRRLGQRFPDAECQVAGELALAVRFPDGMQGELNLDRLNDLMGKTPPSQRAALLDSWLDQVGEVRESADAPIVPVVRSAAFAAQFDGLDGAPISRELAGDYRIFYVFDREASVQYVTPSDTEERGWSDADLHAHAVLNLDQVIDSFDIHRKDDVHMLACGGEYEASLLLYDDYWAEVAAEHGVVIAAAPARDLLAYVTSLDDAALESLRASARKFGATGDRDAISTTLLRWTDTGWNIFVP